MYLQQGYLSKMVVNDRAKQKRGEQNFVGLDAPRFKDVRKSLFPSNQRGKGNDNIFGPCNADGDEDCIPRDAEEMLSSNSEHDSPPRSHQNKKKHCSGAPPQGLPQAEEEGAGPQGPTQAQELPTSPTEQTPANLKRKRGPTKLKTNAVNGGNLIEVQFDENGMPIGEGSVKLSSFLGPLVREIVPYTLSDWRKLPQGMAEVLWQSIQARFNLHEEWHRQMVFRRMNEDWRASKSILVGKVRNASNEEERLKLQPGNVKSLQDWKAFVKEKTSAKFKVKSDKFIKMREKQLELQHTMSRKGYARLTAEMKVERKVASISGFDVWASAHTKKNGQPGNKTIAKTIEDMQHFERNKPNSTNLKEVDGPQGPNQAQELPTSPTEHNLKEVGGPQGPTQAQELPTSPTEHNLKEVDGPQGPTQAQELPTSPIEQTPANLKRKRGPTKLKTIAVNGGNRIEVQFDENGMPIGEGSVKLSSFLGPLVREIVPYTLSDWRKLPQGMAEVLWQSIQARFNLHEEWHRQMVFRRMNEDWRASKSILVGKVRNASNEEERLKLQPGNVKSLQDWKAFLKEKTSAKFKVKSDKFIKMREKQLELQHTMSRKGYARLTAEMKVERKVASISSVDVWASGHTKKNGQPGNETIAKTIEDMQHIERNKPNSTNLKEDDVCEVLGVEKLGRVRTFEKGVTLTRLSILSHINGKFDQVHEENVMLKSQMAQMQISFDEIKKSLCQNRATTEGPPSTSIAPPQYTSHSTKCKLLDWTAETDDVVAEGRWASSDPKVLVHCIPLGPNAMKVWVDIAKKSGAFLWRTTREMTYIEEALGSTVAWPADKVIIESEPTCMG